MCTWTLVILDIKNRLVALLLDMVDGDSTFIIGLDLKQYVDTFYRQIPKTITFKLPTKVHMYTWHTKI